MQHYVGIYELRTTAEKFPKTGTYVVKSALKPAIYATKIILARTNLTVLLSSSLIFKVLNEPTELETRAHFKKIGFSIGQIGQILIKLRLW